MLYIHNNLPTPLWKMARVPSARATNTIPFTCLQQGKGFQNFHSGVRKGPHATELVQRLSKGQSVTDKEPTPEPKWTHSFLHWGRLPMKMSAELNKQHVWWLSCFTFWSKLLIADYWQKVHRPETHTLSGTNSISSVNLTDKRSDFW